MKKIIICLFILSAAMAEAQMKEGRIVYQRVFQLPVRKFNADPAIADQIPKTRTDEYELLFSGNKSLWQYLPDARSEGDANTFAGGGMIIRMAGGTNDVSFHDFANSLKVDQCEIGQKSFVVTDTIRKLEWKLTEETKKIKEYTVKKAVTSVTGSRMSISMENGEMKRTQIADTSLVVAWFTTDIPVSAGPADYQGQLPGVILELDINKGQTVYTATEISSKVNSGKIKEPREGKKLTAAEYAIERQKILEEMRKNMPTGAGSFRIQQ